MTRHLNRQDSDISFQGHLPGCMWSVLHILDYHYWHSSKKISARRKHRRGKHTICCGYPKTISFEHYADEAHEYLDADAVPLIEEHKAMDAEPTNRNSAKARIKALIAKEMSARSHMQQADSFGPLRSSDSVGGMTTDWSNPIIILEKSADATESRLQVPSLQKSPGAFSSDTGDKLADSSLNKNYPDATKLSREISHRQIMECMDVLEIFKINRNMFLEILQDPDVKAAKNFHLQLTSNAKARLKKSGSFPLASSPDNRRLGPSTLEHKSRETWSHRKGEKFNAEVKDPQSIVSKSLEDFLHMPKAVQANDTVVLAVSEESGFASSPLSQGSNKHGRHQSFMGHLKYMMKKIKHGLRESKRQNNQTSADSLLHRVSSRSSWSTDEKDISGKLVDGAIHQDCSGNHRSCHETSSSSKNLSRGQLSYMRRVSSLNESMDRYARLFEYSLTREGKWHEQKSKSLRLTNEDKTPATGYRIKSFKRRLSLQDLDSSFPLPNETAHEGLKSEIPIKTGCDEITNNESPNDSSFLRTLVDGENIGPLDGVEESEQPNNMVEEGNSYEKNEFPADSIVGIKEEIINNGELHVPEKQRHGPYQDQGIGSTISFSREHEERSHVSVLESHIEDHITGHTNFPDLIDSELDCRHNAADEVYSSVNLQDKLRRDCCNSADSENDENPRTTIENHFLHSEIEDVDDADFNYLKDVLEVSGLIQQGYLGSWHSLDQPLSPTLFKELEVYLHHELESSSDDVDSNCNHQLLFDLINEVLLQMYASSLAYFPKNFSFAQRVRPLPKGSHILEEVWKRINWYRSPESNMEQSLDDIVARDLAKDESWMDLQLDLEDIALDLEEWIFDELVDEIMSS